eukprot:TRINITY_DN4935_c0_g3_i1.p1 TRINITY_DN4935_c0_g3~~TRINITY_DN4935_c0_g3_i1.p1  ORF type:complete len:2865 (+),score=453.67 TRINITY_DN4935_c0_g3_i1:925-8595(+)
MAEQTTPSAFALSDSAVSVQSVQAMTDLDLDANEVGGTAEWTRPGYETLVERYWVYLATSLTGTGRTLLGSALAGESALNVSADTPRGSASHLVVYTASALVEQTTPVGEALVDSAVSVSTVAAADRDLDQGQFGGEITWNPPGSTALVADYLVYLAEDVAGTNRSLIGSPVPVGINKADAQPESELPVYSAGGFTGTVLVYTRSTLAEQSTGVGASVSDVLSSVTSIAFPDRDLDALEVGGTVTWSAPSNPSGLFHTTHYLVYFGESSSMSTRSRPGSGLAVPAGTFSFQVPAETALANWTHVAVYTRSSLVEQSTPGLRFPISDTSSEPLDVTFLDDDLDAAELGGTVLWTPASDVAKVSYYRAYFAQGAAGQAKSICCTPTEIIVGTNHLTMLTDNPLASWTHVAVYARSSLAEMTTPVVAEINDTDGLVQDVAFVDEDLDDVDIMGRITWSPPADGEARIVSYQTDLSDFPVTQRSQIGSLVSPGSYYQDVPENSRKGSYTHISVYSRSAAAEQTTPAVMSCSDVRGTVSNLAWQDEDLDPQQIGGTASWQLPADESQTSHYRVYLATGAAAGSSRVLVGQGSGGMPGAQAGGLLPAGTNTTLLMEVGVPSGYAYLSVFAGSSLAEQTTPASTTINDIHAHGENIAFQDKDLDAGDVGGRISWTPHGSTGQGVHYAVYLAQSSAGAGRTQTPLGTIPIGTNFLDLPVDTAAESYTHIVVYVASTLIEQTTPEFLALQDYSVARGTPLNPYTYIQVYCRTALFEQTTPAAVLVADYEASVSSLFFADQDYNGGLVGGLVQWQPPDDASQVTHYAAYLARDETGLDRVAVPGVHNFTVGTNEIDVPSGTALGPLSHLLVYTASELGEQTTPTALRIADIFQGRDLMQVDVSGSPPNVTIDTFTFAGCFRADVDARALGRGYVTSNLTVQSPADCASSCEASEAFIVGYGLCHCLQPYTLDIGAWQRLNDSSCDANCDGWSATDFPTLTTYFASLSGFCGGRTVNIFSVYEQYDAVMAVGQGAIDRTRSLWWQIVLVQSFIGGGGTSDQSEYYNASSWQWRAHASSLTTGRGAYPLHRDLDQPMVGLFMDEHAENPSLVGTTHRGDVYSVYVGARQTPQRVMNYTDYPGHTVDGTPVEPGAAPVVTFDVQRRTMFASQPIGGNDSSIYALELDRADDLPYRHIRFVPFCDATWCAVNELRFRYQGQEIDLSGATTYLLNDLSDHWLRTGAILLDMASPTMIDEFSFSMPYNSTLGDPIRWVLEGTSDRVRRCILNNAPDYQSMPDGTYSQTNGEHRQNKPVYRAAGGEIIYWDDVSASWWVSPTIRNGGYGGIRCVGNAFEPHLLNASSCVAWNGQVWDAAPNVSFDCLGNEWTVLHRQDRYYPDPSERTAPLRWFKASRNEVQWSRIIENLTGHVGQLQSDPNDGYVVAQVVDSNQSLLRTLGKATNSNCSIVVNVTFEDSSDPGSAVDCAATAYGLGGWMWPDQADSGKLWLTCATAAEMEEDSWIQRYVEATADSSWSWSGGLTTSPDAHPLKAQLARILEVAVSPALPDGAWFDGPLDYFVCPMGTNCTTIPSLEVRIIHGSSNCGCGPEVTTIQTHGFYKACYCLPDAPRAYGTSSACDMDGDFTFLAGTVLGMGPEPARLAALTLVLGQSWEFGISDLTTHYSGVYKAMLEYAAGSLFSSLQFPSVVQLTNASDPVCGYNPSACDLVGEVFCTLGELCVVRLNGTSMKSENGIKVLRTSYGCETALAAPMLALFEGLTNPQSSCTRSPGHKAGYRAVHDWDLARPTRGSTAAVTTDEPGPGVYRLCWGYYPTLNESGVLLHQYQQYPIDAGVMMMLGPFAMDFECSLHFQCEIKISGIGLASTNKVYLIESALGRCGMAGIPRLDAEWSAVSNPATVVQDSEGLYNTYYLGIATGKSGASHRLCWAHDPPETEDDGSPLSDPPSHFRVEIDPDFLWIRFTAVVDCVLGRKCNITIYGSGIGPTSEILLITNPGQCGDASAEAVEVVGLSNPTGVELPVVASSTAGVYILAQETIEAPPYGFRICWGPNPSNSSAVNYPLEVYYPMQHQPVIFFQNRVGAMTLVRLDGERGGRHRVLALYGDTTKLPATTKALGGFYDARMDYDCCNMTGFASGAMLQVDGSNRALPSGGYIFHDRPSDTFSAAALSVREPRAQGLEGCGSSCGDDYTSKHTDYVLAAGFRDMSSPEKSPGNIMMLKARPTGPQWAPTWQARRAAQYFGRTPPRGIVDYEVEFRRCTTPDPLAACAYTSRARSKSLKVVRLSSTRLAAAFVDGSSDHGTVVIIDVIHHLPDEWELNVGLKKVVNARPTSNIDLAALSATSLIVAFADETSRNIQAIVLQVTDADNLVAGASVELGTGNLTQDSTDTGSEEVNITNSTPWKYTETHRRLSVCALSSTKALVAFGPIGFTAEMILVVVSGVSASRAVVMSLRSNNIDDISVVPLGATKKAMCIYRDEADDGVAKAQEVDVYDDFNGASYALGPGSLSTLTHFRTEGLVAVSLNATGVLMAYRAMDGTEKGVVSLIAATFNAN